MFTITPGDLVCRRGTQFTMLVISQAVNDELEGDTFFDCAWEYEGRLYLETFALAELQLERREARRLPRTGELTFPRNCHPSPRYAIANDKQ